MKGLLTMKKTIFVLLIPFLVISTFILLVKSYTPSYATKNKSQIETISVSLSDNSNYVVEIDKTNKKINVVKDNNKDCENYINIDLEKTKNILSTLDKNQNNDYIKIFNSIKPYIDTNMSYMDLFSLYNTVKKFELGSINLIQK